MKAINFVVVTMGLAVAAMGLARGESGPESSSGAAVQRMTLAGKVNINTASLLELVQVPGIGPRRAQAIIRYRQRRPFARPTQLRRIKGIGRKTFRRLAPYIAVRGQTKITLITPPKPGPS